VRRGLEMIAPAAQPSSVPLSATDFPVVIAVSARWIVRTHDAGIPAVSSTLHPNVARDANGPALSAAVDHACPVTSTQARMAEWQTRQTQNLLS
jgi:hypothetical protein